jgi:hypothetical protein
MDDFRVKIGFLGHHKTKKLRRRLGSEAVESFLWLWEFCSIEGNGRTDGDLTGMTDEDIELEAEWNGEPGALVQTLVDVGYVDGDPGARRIHKWSRHQPYIANHTKRSDAARNAANKRWADRGHADETPEDANGMRTACGSHADGMRPAQNGNADLCQSVCPGSGSDPGSDPGSEDPRMQTACGSHDHLRQVGAQEGWGNPPPPLLDMCPIPPEVINKALSKTKKAGTPGWGYFTGVVRGENGRTKQKPPKPKPKPRAASPPKEEEEPAFKLPPKELVDEVVGACSMDQDQEDT